MGLISINVRLHRQVTGRACRFAARAGASPRRGKGGKFCRSGIICREVDATIAAIAVVLSVFFLWHAAC
jgi:hypothetical protein